MMTLVRDATQKERDRRTYYQNIVYEVCNLLDGAGFGGVICGTLDEPSTGVQDAVEKLCHQEGAPDPGPDIGCDRNVEEVVAEMRARSLNGLREYGVTTERTDLSEDEWLEHLQHEVMDAAVYLQVLRRRRRKAGRDGE